MLVVAAYSPSRSRIRTTLVTLAVALALALASAGCSSAAPDPTVAPTPEPPPTLAPTPAAEILPPAPQNPNRAMAGAASGQVESILATTVLNPGPQRVAFLLVGEKAIIKAPEAAVSAAYLGQAGDGSAAPVQRALASYHGWPYGIRGSYSTELTFDRPGSWRLNVSVEDGGVQRSAVIDLSVTEDSPVPGIGETPPLSRTKTLGDVEGVEQLTTDYNADADLYRLSVAEVIESPRPGVVVFASPAFCTSATCGPQVDTVKELKATYQDQVDFVHVEIYDLPDEIQGDLSKAQTVKAVEEWGFTSLPHWFNESWVFILDDQGIVRQRFEGFATLAELESALKETLGQG